jgi:16S rRNA (adenine1518-N6/adenine1519-N6)-dimethyltransferase
LSRFNIHPKKGLGQHFLVDDRILEGIISAAELAPGDLVIEIGAGVGILTLELAKRARQVIAIEVDAKLVSALCQIAALSPNIKVINTDILQAAPSELLAASGVVQGDNLSPPHYKVVANLPYYIATASLRHFLQTEPKPGLMIVMVQKEVGEAIVAQPGGMSLLATCVQFYSKPSIIEYVPARSFYPPPKVDSAILRIVPYEQPLVKVSDTVEFFKLVRVGFSAPRKQLRNALAQGLKFSPAEAVALLEKAGINPQRRAETLALQEWAKVYEVVAG